MNRHLRRLCELALLLAISLILFFVELQIPNPVPIPGIKLGLSNIVTVFAVYHYRPYEVGAVMLSRVLLGALFSGNMLALLYSLSGAVLCLIGMLLFKKIIDEKHLWMASVFGAILHNTGQMITALLITKTPGLLAYYPFLLISGCVSGALIGMLASLIINRLKKLGVTFGE